MFDLKSVSNNKELVGDEHKLAIHHRNLSIGNHLDMNDFSQQSGDWFSSVEGRHEEARILLEGSYVKHFGENVVAVEEESAMEIPNDVD